MAGERRRGQPIDAFSRETGQTRADAISDMLAQLTDRTALDAYLAHPATQRALTDLRYSPSSFDLYRRIEAEIAAARELATDPPAMAAPAPSSPAANRDTAP